MGREKKAETTLNWSLVMPVLRNITGNQDKSSFTQTRQPGAEEEERQLDTTTFLLSLSLCVLIKFIVNMLRASFFPFFSRGLMIFTSWGIKYFWRNEN